MVEKIVYKNTITYLIPYGKHFNKYHIQINTDNYSQDILSIVDDLLMACCYENIIIAENILHQNENKLDNN